MSLVNGAEVSEFRVHIHNLDYWTLNESLNKVIFYKVQTNNQKEF